MSNDEPIPPSDEAINAVIAAHFHALKSAMDADIETEIEKNKELRKREAFEESLRNFKENL